jgi:hypothetical protein
MSTLGKLSRIESESGEFAPYLTILTPQFRVHFVDTFEREAARFLTGDITAQDFGRIVAELKRDAKGTAATCQQRRDAQRRGSLVTA